MLEQLLRLSMALITLIDVDDDLLSINSEKIIAIDWNGSTEIKGKLTEVCTIYLEWAGQERLINIPRRSHQELMNALNLPRIDQAAISQYLNDKIEDDKRSQTN